MSEPRQPLARIVVAGDGPLGVLAAVLLKRALPRCELVIVGTPPDPDALAERSPTALPFSVRIFERAGLSEEQLVTRCGASHRLVTRYVNWHAEGEHGLAAYGAEVDPRLNTGFARAWGAGPRNASSLSSPGSLAEVLAEAGRYAPPWADLRAPLAGIDAALRWHPGAAREQLVQKAVQLGVRHLAGAITGVEPDGAGGIAAVAVEGAGAVAAELFVDCTGPGAALYSKLPDARRIDWSAVLPVRTMLIARPGDPMLALEDRVTLGPSGWRWEIAGRDGLQAMVGVGERHDPAAAGAALGNEIAATISVAPGRAAEPWLGNVVALGDAAARFEPLVGFGLDLAHRQLDLLLELLPGREIDPLERAEYNRRAGLMADGARDALSAHYATPAARAVFGEFEIPDSLKLSLDQFARRGRLPFFEEAPLLAQELASLFHALRLPEGEGALARTESRGQSEARARAFSAGVEEALAAAPPYRDWMMRALTA